MVSSATNGSVRTVGGARGVPRGQAEDSVRPRILRGAAETFGRLGYGATSVEAILEASSVSRRTFYRTFRNKEDVLGVLFEASVELLLNTVRETNRTSEAGLARLESGVEAYLRIHAEAGPLARVLLTEQFSPDSPLAKQRDEAMNAFAEFLQGAFVAEGNKPDPLLVHGVVAAINQIAVRMACEHPAGAWDLERAKKAMVRILIALDDRVDPSNFGADPT